MLGFIRHSYTNRLYKAYLTLTVLTMLRIRIDDRCIVQHIRVDEVYCAG
jgi:hypothetical protein